MFEKSHRRKSEGWQENLTPPPSIAIMSAGEGVRCFGGFLRVPELGAPMADES